MIDPHTNPSEWIKILVSTLAGFLAGMIADLFKTSFNDRRTRKRLRKALYTELAFLRSYIKLSMEVTAEGNLKEQTFDLIIKTLKRNVYVAAVAQPDVFHQLKEAPYIIVLYTLLDVLDSPTAPVGGARIACDNFIKLIDDYVGRGYLQIKRFPDLSTL